MAAAKRIQIIREKILAAGWTTRTDRFYPRQALQQLVKQFSPGIGELMFDSEQTSLRMDLYYASHRTERLYLKNEDTELWGEFHILDTRCGLLLADLYKTKNVRFDCLMMGKVNPHSEVIPESLQYLRTSAFPVYEKAKPRK